MDSLQRLAVCWQRMNLCRYVLRRWSGRLCLMWVFLRRQNALSLCLHLLATAVSCFTILLCIAVCLSRKVVRAVVLPWVCPLTELMLSRRRIPLRRGCISPPPPFCNPTAAVPRAVCMPLRAAILLCPPSRHLRLASRLAL